MPIIRRAFAIAFLAAAFPVASAPEAFVSYSAQGCSGSCYHQLRAFPDDRYELRIFRLEQAEPLLEEGSLPGGTYRASLGRIERAGFDRFSDRYVDEACATHTTDQSETVIEVLSDKGSRKKVRHDHGCLGFRRRAELVQLENDLALIFDVDNRARLLDERVKATADVSSVLERAGSVELLSLDSGEGRDRHWRTMCQGWCFYGWPVLGTTRLTAPGEIATIRDELGRWLAAPEPEAIALCFSPRHGVRVRDGEHVYDFVICYECGELDLHVDFSEDSVQKFRGGDQEILDALFRAHDVLYPPRRKHE